MELEKKIQKKMLCTVIIFEVHPNAMPLPKDRRSKEGQLGGSVSIGHQGSESWSSYLSVSLES